MLGHGLDQLPMMPALEGEAPLLARAPPPHDLHVPMEPLPLHALTDHPHYQVTAPWNPRSPIVCCMKAVCLVVSIPPCSYAS